MTGNGVASPWQRQIPLRHWSKFSYVTSNCPSRPLTSSMCSSSASKGENVFFAEFLPRVGVYQISFATRRNCRLTVCPRGVVYTELRHSGTEEGEEIFTWPPHLPDLDPGSFLDPHKLASGTSIPPLQLRFRCIRTCHTVRADFEKILDPPDLAPVLRSTAFAVKCGFCGNRLTRPG